MKDLIAKNETMSSTQLAEMLGYEKKEVNRKIKLMFPEKIEGGIISPTLRLNKQVENYNLPELESKMFVAKNDITYLEQITQYWIDRENDTELSLEEMTKLVIEKQQDKIDQQQKSINVKDELIIASNEASIKAGEILVREFVKSVDIIDIGEKLFYQWMRKQGFLMDSNQPYQTLVKRGFFSWKPSEEKYGGRFRYTLRVTPRGKVWLSAKYMKFLDHTDLAA